MEAALEHLPSGVASVGDVVQRLGDSDTSLSVDKPTFVSLMVERAVADFGAGEAALLPAFEALDADGSGTVTQQQLLSAVDELCAAWPEAEGWRTTRWTTASSDWGWRTTRSPTSPTTRSCSTTSASSKMVAAAGASGAVAGLRSRGGRGGEKPRR